MNEQRLNAYLTLINNLLTCPSDEELKILQDNQELLDQDFLQVLLAISSQLQGAGRQQEAELLINLAEELSAFMGNTNSSEDYYNFLMKVLQAVLESRGNPQIVYPLFQQNLDKLDENLAYILKNRVTATLKELSLEAAIYMAAVITEFGNLILQFPLGSRKNNLEISIATSQATLEIYTREAFPEQWAGTQNNLANAYKDRIKGEKAENIERAIRFYQAALEIINRVAFPEDWAMIQNNLANAYSNRIKGEKAQNIEQAIAAYQSALEIRTREAFPKQWATTQNNLALAYSNRIKGEKAENIERAIAAYQAALEIRTREVFPEQWAETQNNLAVAYYYRIKGEKVDNIERAIGGYQVALEIYTREAFPERWADTQNNLALAYYYRIKGEKAQNIERAIAFYQAALEIRTREAFPEQWAETQNNLANAYSYRIIGEKADNAENIERAIAFYQAALEIRTREAFPEQWAETQNNLALAYSNRIKREKADNIDQAIAFYKAALEIYTRAAFPYNYVLTSYNLGLAYQKSQQWQLAYETFDNAIETLEEIRAGIVKGGDADKQKLAEEWQDLYQRMVEVCIELKNYTAAIEYVERSKTRNLVELLATRDLYPKGDIPQTVLDELDRLRRNIETEQRRLEIEERTRNPFGDGTTGERSANIAALQTPPPDRSRLNELRQQLDDLITRDITPIDPDFLLTQKVQPMPFSDIQALTGDNTAILEWYILSDRFVVFIVTPSSSPSRRGDGGEVKLWQSTPEEYNALTAWAGDYLTAYRTDKKQWQIHNQNNCIKKIL
ncbi:tetratricopeptide repeat protein [Planktothrix agardhii]|jgi:tetratricopeptide (TPR) repeat protein|uniref:tetratricopeptide repeat protein n=1 Tax=Planktothrix agardhii TaxID=1160 RepID=UPI003784672B